jgi:uncharacterized protein DUF2628
MPVYTVHEPPRRSDDRLAHTARFAFVRDGFHWGAFLLAPLWLLRHRLWLEFIAYLLLAGAVTYALRRLGVPGPAGFGAAALLALLIGLEASSLRRWKLARRGFVSRGVVVGDDREAAERRFFDAWLHEDSARPVQPPAPPVRSAPSAPDIVGLFPQPGARP